VLSDGWWSEPTPLPIRMVSDGVPPVFSTSTSDTLPAFAPLCDRARAVTRINFTDRQLSDVTLDNSKYYIPATANHSFDFFAIDFYLYTVAISVFQITTSSSHKGSAEGYRYIRRTMYRVRKLLKEMKSDGQIPSSLPQRWIPAPVADARRLGQVHRNPRPSRRWLLYTHPRLGDSRYVVLIHSQLCDRAES